jgi:hypothetical protein
VRDKNHQNLKNTKRRKKIVQQLMFRNKQENIINEYIAQTHYQLFLNALIAAVITSRHATHCSKAVVETDYDDDDDDVTGQTEPDE